MVYPMITLPVLKKLIGVSDPQRQELKKIYARLPQTHCQRQTRCCSLLPEMTLLEALQVLEKMGQMPSSLRMDLIRQTIHYFFVNPAKITTCPFLKGQDCLIYPHRFFGCRAYGLWSQTYYQDLVEHSRQAKLFFRLQWEKLGVNLPKEVVDFQVPYCSLVKTDSLVPVNYEFLLKAWNDIESLSQVLNAGHHFFKTSYLSDLSFFLAGLTFGLRQAVQLKFLVVQDLVQKGNSGRLDQLINQCTDLLAEP
jgi:Fe-S-cluster containining protein